MTTTDSDRRAELGRRFDQGLHGHAAGDREAWIDAQLAGTVNAPGSGEHASSGAPGPVPALERDTEDEGWRARSERYQLELAASCDNDACEWCASTRRRAPAVCPKAGEPR